MTRFGSVDQATVALVAAPAQQPRTKSHRAFITSGRLSRALSRVPETKPAWTAIVSQAACPASSDSSATRVGVTAVAENQSVMPSSSPRATSPSILQAMAVYDFRQRR